MMGKRRKKPSPRSTQAATSPISTVPAPMAILEQPGNFWYLLWSPDGRFLVIKWAGRNVLLYDTRSWQIAEELPLETFFADAFLSGGRLLSWKDGKLLAWDIDEHRPAWESDTSGLGKLELAAINANGTVILFRDFRRLDATTGEWLRTDRRFIHDGRPHALLPDGKIPPELRDPPSAKLEYEEIIGITPDGRVVVT
ncbi:MAG: hypothetical protein Q6370_006300, partial [Candidatus Sigynarchaeota archaeon]